MRPVLDYVLDGEGMTISLAATNPAAIALPFGLGFHPWFPRTPATQLMAKADLVWLEDSRHLPTEQAAVASRPEWDFSSFRSLPDRWINNGFVGWNGCAAIRWNDRALALEVETRPALSHYLLYSPAADSSFFCFEPVSHAVNAHNLPPGPEASRPGRPGSGHHALQAGPRASTSCRIGFQPVSPGHGTTRRESDLFRPIILVKYRPKEDGLSWERVVL
jgi:galactose mutarotase-like enzyme